MADDSFHNLQYFQSVSFQFTNNWAIDLSYYSAALGYHIINIYHVQKWLKKWN